MSKTSGGERNSSSHAGLNIDPAGWLTSTRHVCSPNYNCRPPNVKPSLLVVHCISLPPGKFGGAYVEQFFTNCLSAKDDPYFEQIHHMEVSAHCFIDRLGRVTQFVSFLDRAWHAGVSVFEGLEDCNNYSIGVELEGTDTLPYTGEQYKALTRLAAELIHQYPDIDVSRIVGHQDIAPGRKTDPGPAFDWQQFHYLLSKEL